MIGTLAPLRISFIGGGTDIPKFYNKYGPLPLFVHIRV